MPVARPPATTKGRIPVGLQKRAAATQGKSFLEFLYKEITLEERETLMLDELQRRKSFHYGWPHSGELSGKKMAQAGFYSCYTGDRVQCVFCRGVLHEWETDDVPMVEHRRSFVFCRFVKDEKTDNIVYRSEKLTAHDKTNITTFHTDQEAALDFGFYGVSTVKAWCPQYATLTRRLATFSRWPRWGKLRVENACDAGFFYVGFADEVGCFYCGGYLKQWEDTDDAWTEHARWFPECEFLKQLKGQAYIDSIHASTPDRKKAKHYKPVARTKTTPTENERIISYQREICFKLGHEHKYIDKALEIVPQESFGDIKVLIDRIYELEEKDYDNNDNDSVESLSLSLESLNLDPITPVIHIPQVHEGLCKLCITHAEKSVPATRLGLPCGHLIFCETCHEKQVHSNSPTVAISCPYLDCNSKLNGTLKVFFS